LFQHFVLRMKSTSALGSDCFESGGQYTFLFAASDTISSVSANGDKAATDGDEGAEQEVATDGDGAAEGGDEGAEQEVATGGDGAATRRGPDEQRHFEK
jgi:hypothetical protein